MEKQSERRKILLTIKAKAAAKRTWLEKIADSMTAFFGSISFLFLNAIFLFGWILMNTGMIGGVDPFDPFPFNLLTTVVSLEAIFLAIFVLISQNRGSKVDDLREETNLQLNLIEEKENAKIVKMLAILLEKTGVDVSKDPEIREMIRPTSEEEIERNLEKELF